MVFDLCYGVWRIGNAVSLAPGLCCVSVGGARPFLQRPPSVFSCVSEMMLEIWKMCCCDFARHYQKYGIQLHSGSFAFSFSEMMFLQGYFKNLYLQFPSEH